MKHIRLENNRIRFPTLPRFDAWLERWLYAVIAVLAAAFTAVWVWGASL